MNDTTKKPYYEIIETYTYKGKNYRKVIRNYFDKYIKERAKIWKNKKDKPVFNIIIKQIPNPTRGRKKK